MKRMLLIFAHPDDESFYCGGTISKYVKNGWHVDLVCATRGERGSTGPYDKAKPSTLAGLRQKELEKAAEILGISSITFLEYGDGSLGTLHTGELEDKVYQALVRYTPDVVITFEPHGISNHPDHIKISLSTTFAFYKYAKLVVGLDVPVAPKLYFACMPKSVVAHAKKIKMLPDISFDKPWQGVEDKLVTTVIDISKFMKKKRSALRAHITQRDNVDRFLSISNNPFLVQEYFVQRYAGIRETFMGKHDAVSNKL